MRRDDFGGYEGGVSLNAAARIVRTHTRRLKRSRKLAQPALHPVKIFVDSSKQLSDFGKRSFEIVGAYGMTIAENRG